MKYLFLILLVSINSFAGNTEGGNGGRGGGDILPIGDVTKADVKYVLGQASLLEPILNQLEKKAIFDIRNKNVLTAVVNKLYAEKANILANLIHARIVMQAEPCIEVDEDGVTREHDGGASSVGDKKEICISYGRIIRNPKVVPQNIYPTILSLLAHELGHLSGLSEAEAVLLQNEIFKTFENVKPEVMRDKLSDLAYNMKSYSSRFERFHSFGMDDSEVLFNSQKRDEACDMLKDAIHDASIISLDLDNTIPEVLAVSTRVDMASTANYFRMSYLEAICDPITLDQAVALNDVNLMNRASRIERIMARHRKVFAGQQDLDVESFLSGILIINNVSLPELRSYNDLRFVADRDDLKNFGAELFHLGIAIESVSRELDEVVGRMIYKYEVPCASDASDGCLDSKTIVVLREVNEK